MKRYKYTISLTNGVNLYTDVLTLDAEVQGLTIEKDEYLYYVPCSNIAYIMEDTSL